MSRKSSEQHFAWAVSGFPKHLSTAMALRHGTWPPARTWVTLWPPVGTRLLSSLGLGPVDDPGELGELQQAVERGAQKWAREGQLDALVKAFSRVGKVRAQRRRETAPALLVLFLPRACIRFSQHVAPVCHTATRVCNGVCELVGPRHDQTLHYNVPSQPLTVTWYLPRCSHPAAPGSF